MEWVFGFLSLLGAGIDITQGILDIAGSAEAAELTAEELARQKELQLLGLDLSEDQARINMGLIDKFMADYWPKIQEFQTASLNQEYKDQYRQLTTALGLDPETASLSLDSQYGQVITGLEHSAVQVAEQKTDVLGELAVTAAATGREFTGTSVGRAYGETGRRYDRTIGWIGDEIGNKRAELAGRKVQADRSLIDLFGEDRTMDLTGGLYALAYENMQIEFASFEDQADAQRAALERSLEFYEESERILNPPPPPAAPPADPYDDPYDGPNTPVFYTPPVGY